MPPRTYWEKKMPWIDPIVEETRKARNEYAASLGYDLKKMYQDLKKKNKVAAK